MDGVKISIFITMALSFANVMIMMSGLGHLSQQNQEMDNSISNLWTMPPGTNIYMKGHFDKDTKPEVEIRTPDVIKNIPAEKPCKSRRVICGATGTMYDVCEGEIFAVCDKDKKHKLESGRESE